MGLILLALFPVKTDEGIKFIFFAPDAKSVFISGDFNGWGRTPMDMDEKGFWSVEMELKPGRYEYKYVVDGEWIPDPDNPVVSGPYKNSVIIVDKKGNVLLPYSSSISFSGINRMMMYVSRDSLASMNIDALLDLNLFLSSVSAWSRFRYSGGSIYLQRAKALFGPEKTKLVAFYNTYALRSKDPLHIIGSIGKYRDSLGRDYSGIYLKERDNLIFYANNNSDGSDLYGWRLRAGYQGIYVGATGQIKDWYGYETLVDSPYTYYSRKKTESFAFDLFYKGWKLELDKKSGYRGIYSYEVNGETKDTSMYGRLYKRQRIYTGWGDGKKYFWIRFVELLFPDGNYISSIQGRIGLSIKKLKLVFTDIYFLKGNDAPWEYLFYHSYIQKLKIIQYLNVGYREMTDFWFSWKGNPGPFRMEVEGLLTKPGIMSKYFAFEFCPSLKTKGKLGIGADVRYARYRYPELNTDFTDPFLYLFFSPWGSSEFRISMGLDPTDLEDQERARETYLEDKGITLSTLKNYAGLIPLLENAEKSLSDYRKIEIRITVRF